MFRRIAAPGDLDVGISGGAGHRCAVDIPVGDAGHHFHHGDFPALAQDFRHEAGDFRAEAGTGDGTIAADLDVGHGALLVNEVAPLLNGSKEETIQELFTLLFPKSSQ
jgi:hypothetical protein